MGCLLIVHDLGKGIDRRLGVLARQFLNVVEGLGPAAGVG
jgi:hypothetical protein